MRVSDASLESLEFSSLRKLGADFASTDLGREVVLNAQPFADATELAVSLARTRSLDVLLSERALIPRFDEDLRSLGTRVAGDGIELTGLDLVMLADVLAVAKEALDRVVASESRELLRMAARVPDLGWLAVEIRRRLDDKGRVRDDASRRLVECAKKTAMVRRKLYDDLNRFVSRYGNELAEDTVPLYDGRLVVLLNSGSKGRIPGVVKGRSSSGRSFYFEPLEFVEANNEFEESQREERRERKRILAALFKSVTQSSSAIAEVWKFVGDLDARQSLCRWCRQMDGRFVSLGSDRRFELREARHPLLDPSLAGQRERALGHAGHTGSVVPLDLDLSSDKPVLVLSGPNAGGKTVALKTVGLLATAIHCGFPVPVGAETSVPFLAALVAVVGDEQDLLSEKSTFSGRLIRLKEAWDNAQAGRLLLVDELGSGTDPTEGAALGVSLIEELAERGPWTIATTHLTPIAATAFELERVRCAAMEFNAKTGEPTFRLAPGAPGSSEALSLARRLGLNSAWINRAEELLGPGERRLRRMLKDIEELREALHQERENLIVEHRQAAAEHQQASELKQALEVERAELSRRLKRELRDFRSEIRSRLGKEVERVRDQARRTTATKSREAAKEAEARLWQGAPSWSEPSEEIRPSVTLESVGKEVEHANLGWSGTLVRLKGDGAEVVVNGKRVRCAAADLVVGEDRGGPGSAAPAGKKDRWAQAAGLDHLAVRAIEPELHLRRMLVDEALEKLDQYLDRAIRSGLSEVRLIHGHGTGRLRSAVRAELARHPAVESHRPGRQGEGGNGVTVATLAG